MNLIRPNGLIERLTRVPRFQVELDDIERLVREKGIVQTAPAAPLF